MSVNKALMEHNNAHSFKHCLRLLSSYSGRAEWLGQRKYGPQSQKYFLSGAFEKTFAEHYQEVSSLPPISFPVYGGMHLRLPLPRKAVWINVAFLWARIHT